MKADGTRATREEFEPARAACATVVTENTKRASEAFASDVWAFEMRKCLKERGFDLVEEPRTPAAE
jgi:hypothetical protein